ncbi:DUF2889 domain-containing protein [Paraburkholderia sp. A2WS-5]|uniref:DUF2889 domain-containing protein n=1 Tax=unclassified Paraburkholderia TaxID=2615204 RepID=UPI003B81FDE7
MPLSSPAPRQLRHQRAIRAVAYEREDGLWDIDACLTDHKPRDVPLAAGVRPNGSPIHELWLRITIDRKLNVVDAEASSDWVPYDGQCQNAHPAYRALIGLNLLKNFRREAGRLLAGTVGCTHLTEMLGVLPTVAVQAFAGEVWEISRGTPGEASGQEPSKTADGEAAGETPPFQLGRCHALRFDGEAVRQFYPRWYGHVPQSIERGAQASSVRDNPTGLSQEGRAGVLAHE